MLSFLGGIGWTHCLAQSFNTTLLDHWSDDNLTTNSSLARYNDCFGFSYREKNYAVIGSTEGVHFFKVEDFRLEYVDSVTGDYAHSSVIHRDMKVYGDYLYAVCDEGPSGLQIINLQSLPDSVHLVKSLQSPFGRIHNLFIDTSNALLYAFIVTELVNGLPVNQHSMRVFTLEDPENPELIYTGPNDILEVHDGYVRNNLAFLNCGFDGLRIYDFSNPMLPAEKQRIEVYQDQGYNHQGILNFSGKYYAWGDETNGKRLKLAQQNQNGDWQVIRQFGVDMDAGSVPHNLWMDEHFIYVAYYNSGLQIFRNNQGIVELVGFFDTYPDDQPFKMNGAWGVYGYNDGTFLVSDRQYGLFLIGFDPSAHMLSNKDNWLIYPSPQQSGKSLRLKMNQFFEGNLEWEVLSLKGEPLSHGVLEKFDYTDIPLFFGAGMYQLRIKYFDSSGIQQLENKKFVVH